MTVGRNKGKKYVKLKGFEQPTPQSQARADLFMVWYGDNFELLRDKLIFEHLYDDEIATDTALAIYDNIALKGSLVQDFKFYYLRAYHTNRIAALRRKTGHTEKLVTFVNLPDENQEEYRGQYEINQRGYQRYFAVPAFDQNEHSEMELDRLNADILEYVRNKYDPFAVSLFEIYMGLHPNTSYKRLSVMLGISLTQVWTCLGAIRKDLAEAFRERQTMLS